VKEICTALLESDVNVRLVQSLRKSIKHKVDFKNLPAGSNRKRYIAKAVFDELVALVDTHEKPYEPKPKKTNVIMLVGLQGAGKTTTCTKVCHYTATALMGIAGVILSAERVQVMSGLRGHIPCRGVRSIETECN
jgi:signal recognition particle subunit SRP54